MTVPDPFPLRNIPVPPEVTAVEGCNCGGMEFHRTDCTLFLLPPETIRAAVEAAEAREARWGAALNARLRAALPTGSVAAVSDSYSAARPEPPGDPAAACRGKDFEHHERTDVDQNDEGLHQPWRWRCPACGTRGSLETINTRLIALVPMLYRLKEQMLDQGAVFLLPSGATPGKMGQFHGHDLYRVQGISEPVIALRAVP